MCFNVGDIFQGIYSQACRLADKIGVKQAIPHVSGVHFVFQSNAPARSVEENSKLDLAIPPIDSVSIQMKECFSDVSRWASKLLNLVPSPITNEDFVLKSLEDAISQYSDAITNEYSLKTQIVIWRVRFLKCSKDNVHVQTLESSEIHSDT